MTPAAQLELDLARTRPAAPRRPLRLVGALARSAGLGLLHWTPVWVPLIFLAQVLVLGFLPARTERDRLDRAESGVRARAAALEAEERELAGEALMLGDPIFRERVRRSLVDPRAAPLSLERARAAATSSP
jgi:hypothetical protein